MSTTGPPPPASRSKPGSPADQLLQRRISYRAAAEFGGIVWFLLCLAAEGWCDHRRRCSHPTTDCARAAIRRVCSAIASRSATSPSTIVTLSRRAARHHIPAGGGLPPHLPRACARRKRVSSRESEAPV